MCFIKFPLALVSSLAPVTIRIRSGPAKGDPGAEEHIIHLSRSIADMEFEMNFGVLL